MTFLRDRDERRPWKKTKYLKQSLVDYFTTLLHNEVINQELLSMSTPATQNRERALFLLYIKAGRGFQPDLIYASVTIAHSSHVKSVQAVQNKWLHHNCVAVLNV